MAAVADVVMAVVAALEIEEVAAEPEVVMAAAAEVEMEVVVAGLEVDVVVQAAKVAQMASKSKSPHTELH